MSELLTRRERSIARKYRRIARAEEKAAAQYELRDRLVLEIAKQLGGHGRSCRVSAEKKIEVIDNYRAAIEHPKLEPGQMPKAWGHASVRQFDVKESKIAAEA